MNKSFLFVIMMVAASFTGCIDSDDSEDALTDPIGEVNVPGNALVFTRDADATECSNGGITLDVGVDDDGDGTLNATEIFNTSTICNGANGIDGKDGSSCSASSNDNGTYTVSCTDGTNFTVSDGLNYSVEEEYTPTIINFDEKALLGSWRSPMKNTNISIDNLGNCVEDESWLRTDSDSMIDMMDETGQNTYVAHISGGIGSCEWLSLVDLLESAGNSDSKNIWLGLKDSLNASTYIDFMEAYALIDNADHVGKAVVIDDFHQKLFTPWFYQEDKLHNTHLYEMRQALDVDNKQIDFIPYVSAHHSMMHVLPSIALGVGTCWVNCYDNNSYVFETDDLLSVTWNFDLELHEAQRGVHFESFLYDTLDKTFNDRDMQIVFEFDGIEIGHRSLMNDEENKDGVMNLKIDLPPTYAGNHNFTINLKAIDKPITKTHSKMVFISDPKITFSGETLFELPDDGVTFKREKGSSQASSDYMFATHNWWRINDLIDGMMFKWMNQINSDDYSSHEKFVNWACRALDMAVSSTVSSEVSNRKCIEVYWGDQQWTGFEGYTAEDYFHFYQATANHTDGLIVWRLDNQRHDMDSGIYAEKGLSDSDAPFVSMYPSHTPATEGWYQQWNFSVVEDGYLNLTINDLVHKQYYDRMFVIIEVNNLEYHRYDVAGPQSSDSISLGVSSDDLITIRFETYASFGSVIWYVEIAGTLNDVIIERDIATYSSGSSAFNEFMFKFTTTAFRGEDLADFII